MSLNFRLGECTNQDGQARTTVFLLFIKAETAWMLDINISFQLSMFQFSPLRRRGLITISHQPAVRAALLILRQN